LRVASLPIEIDVFVVYRPELDAVILSDWGNVAPEPYLIETAPITDLLVGANAADGVSGLVRKGRRSLVVKHALGKGESTGSIPVDGSISSDGFPPWRSVRR
jgi:hypothetical protein